MVKADCICYGDGKKEKNKWLLPLVTRVVVNLSLELVVLVEKENIKLEKGDVLKEEKPKECVEKEEKLEERENNFFIVSIYNVRFRSF